MKHNIPLVYLHQVTKGRYFVAWPVFIVADDPKNLRVTVSAETSEVLKRPEILEEPETGFRQKYQTRTIISRLHQGAFRERVLKAYEDQCCICRLKHRILLDAAHIIPDSLGGKPEVYNGLTLCKIHHTAYDQNILGVTPDYEVKIREDILHEMDGPMLKHGLQELNNTKLWTPRETTKKPKKEFLDIRYQEFVNRQSA